MRIIEEIELVEREFVSGVDLMLSLASQEGVSMHQLASWFMRRIKAFDQLQMIDFNRDRRDFRYPEGPYSSEIFNEILNAGRWGNRPDAAENVEMLWEGEGDGYQGGWLSRQLEEFFKENQLEYPRELIRGLQSRAKPSPIQVIEREPGLSLEDPTSATTLDCERSLGTRERTSLLVTIAALAQEANISLVTPSKSAQVIANMTTKLGAPVGKRTIEEHLKKISDAIERQSR
jgi:hypothetical protein